MKLVLNPSKPFYKNENLKNIRMGNFQETGKEIEYEDNNFIKILELLLTPIERDDLISKIKELTSLSKTQVEEIINYLIDEEFIVRYKDIENILANNYYNRELLYFYMFSTKNTENNFQKIQHKNILVLGVGGVGCITTDLLVRSGFDNFTIVDCDTVEPSNLIRQTMYDLTDIKKRKVDVAKEKILRINIKAKVKTIHQKIEQEIDIESEIAKADFVLCTLDKPLRVIRRIVNKLCVDYNKPVLFCGFSEHVGMIGPFIVPQKTACLSCIEKENLTDEIPLNNIHEVPSFGPLCSIISSIAATEITNYFIQFKQNNLQGKTLMFNTYDYTSKIEQWNKLDNCERCGHNDNKKY